MSQPAAPPSAVEINARFAELTAQRDAAQARTVLLAGRNAELLDLLQHYQKQAASLQNEIATLRGEPLPPATEPPASGAQG